MTVSTNLYFDEWTGTGSLTARAVPFPALSANHLTLTVAGVAKVLGTHYTITGNLREVAGAVAATLTPLEAWTGTVRLERFTPDGQVYDLEAQHALSADDLEYELDRQAMIAIEREGRDSILFGRCVKVASGTAPDMPSLTGQAGKVLVAMPDGGLGFATMGGADSALRTDLAAGSGSSFIGWIVDAVGAVSRSLRNKLLETTYITPADFGADKTGATNTTAALKAFYDHCIETGRTGYVPAGTYKITPGQLLFDNGGVDKAWPDILTAGHAAVTYRADPVSSVDEPFIIVTNGRAGSANPGGNWTGGDGNYWSGGSHGGVTFEDTGGAGKTNRHCFELQGWTYPKFGFMLRKGTGGGSGIYLPLAWFNDAYEFNGVGANNPDACAVTQMDIEGIEVLRGRYTIENRNYVGMDSWNVRYARGIDNTQGGIFGTGQGCTYLSGSFASCAGWAWDDGTNLYGTGNRNIVTNFEIDDCQYGIRVNRLSSSKFLGIRMNHRYNSSFTPLNTGEGFWPRQCFSIASGASSNAISLQFENIIHRIQPLEPGVNPAGKGGGPAYGYNALGTLLLTINPGSVVGVTYDHQYIDGAGLGVVAEDWASGFTLSSDAIFKSSGETFFSSLTHSIAEVSYSGGAPTVVNTGMAGVGSIVRFNSERLNKEGRYNPATYGYTVPWTGYLEVTAKVEITVSDGTRVRMSFARQTFGAGAYFASTWIVKFKKGAGSEVFDHPRSVIPVTKGDVVYLMMDQNTGAGTPMTPSIGASASCTATYRMVGDR